MRDVLPNGLLGLAITGLLAAFMAGMAANISAFNTVFSYDLWQTYVVKDRPDEYYLKVGRVITVVATVAAIGTALIASGYSNLMDYLQQLFSFFNAPLFATFILGMFWKRMTATAGWVGLVTGTASAVFIFVLSETGVIDMPGQGASFLRRGRVRGRHRGQRGGEPGHHAETGLRAARAGLLPDPEGGPDRAPGR